MPPIPQPSNVVQCTFRFTGPAGTSAVNVLHGQTPTPNSGAGDLQGLANSLFTAWSASTAPGRMLKHISSQISLTEVDVVDLDEAGAEGISNLAPVAGPDSTTPVPPGVALCVSWKIASRYRGGHPRSYLFGLGSGNLTAPGSRDIATAAASDIANCANAFLVAANAIVLPSGVSFKLGTIRRPTTKNTLTEPLFFPYTAASCDIRLDSQRRRNGPAPA